MKNTIKRYLCTYLIVIASFITGLLLVSAIPQSWIKANAYSGRENAVKGIYPLFRLAENNNYSTFTDTAADELMMDLSYDLGFSQSSIINPSAFLEHANSEIKYGRYWHGYAIYIRFMLLFLNQKEITILLSITTTVCLISLLCALLYKKQYILALSLAFAAYLTYFEIVIKCMEFMFCMIISLVFAFYLCMREDIKYRYLTYFIVGMLVAYFDFLTFETLALTLPLIVDLTIHEEHRTFKGTMLASINWVAGYILTFITKFVLLAVTHADMSITKTKFAEKIVNGYPILEVISVNLNSVRLFNLTVWLILLSLTIFITYVMGNHCKENYYYLLIGFIPIVRYIVLSGHSGSHFAFTYHALLSSVMCISAILFSPAKFFIFDTQKFKTVINPTK